MWDRVTDYGKLFQPSVKSIKERFPGKPIRYAVPTHHHLDHAGGIRAFMAEGAAIVVPFNAQAFYAKVARAPHTRHPDTLERSKAAVVIEAFGGGPRVLSDGARQVEVHPLDLRVANVLCQDIASPGVRDHFR